MVHFMYWQTKYLIATNRPPYNTYNLPYDFYVKISNYLSYLPARASQEVGMVLQVGKENIFLTCTCTIPTSCLFMWAETR